MNTKHIYLTSSYITCEFQLNHRSSCTIKKITEKANRATDTHNMNSASRVIFFTPNKNQSEVSQKMSNQNTIIPCLYNKSNKI